MTIKVNAELDIKEVLDIFFAKLKENGIDGNTGKFLIKVQNKNGEFVEVAQEKIKIEFSKE